MVAFLSRNFLRRAQVDSGDPVVERKSHGVVSFVSACPSCGEDADWIHEVWVDMKKNVNGWVYEAHEPRSTVEIRCTCLGHPNQAES